MMSNPDITIDYSKITDGFGQLCGYDVYMPFTTFCGICDDPMVLTPREQKYLLEIKGVPVKFIQRGAAYCQHCAKRRARINFLARGERWRQEPDGEVELRRLRLEESEQKRTSHKRFRWAKWPYGAA